MQFGVRQLFALTTLAAVAIAVLLRLSVAVVTVRVDELSEGGVVEGVAWTLTVDVPQHDDLDTTPHKSVFVVTAFDLRGKALQAYRRRRRRRRRR